jgi:mannose-6-phosphate isomerase-like protein (cupin superfamily)
MTTSLAGVDQEEVMVGSERIRFRLTSERSGGEVAVLDVSVTAGGGPPMLHRHDPFELYCVRSGELTFYVEDEGGTVKRTVVGPGAVVPIGPGREHTVRNESDKGAEATVIFSPGEAVERFVRVAAELGGEQTPGPDEVRAVAEAHGIEITRSIEDALSGEGREARGAARTLDSGYLSIARFSGDGDRLLGEYRKYADVMSGVGSDHGLILHAGAQTKDGFLIVNVWPSKEGSEAAAADPRRLGVIERIGLSPDQVRREHHDVARIEVFG